MNISAKKVLNVALWFALGLAVSTTLSFCSSGESADSALTWTNPTENVDDTPLTDLAGIKVYRDLEDCNNPQLIATLGDVESYNDIDIPGGNNCYMVTAFDTSGNESAYSNKAYKMNDTVPPKAATGLGIN